MKCHSKATLPLAFINKILFHIFLLFFLGQSPVPEEEEAVVAPQIEPQLNNIDFLQGKDQAFGVGSASIQSLNEEPQEVIDIVEYDATIPGDYQLLCWVWIIEKLQFLLFG